MKVHIYDKLSLTCIVSQVKLQMFLKTDVGNWVAMHETQ